MSWTAALIILFAGVVVSGLLSGMEAGVLTVNRLRIRQLMRAGNAKARLLNGFLDNPENFLWTILVGNTMANILVISLGVDLLLRALGHEPILFVAVFVPGVWVFYALGDLLPKMLFRMFPNRLSMSVARLFRIVHLVLSPLVFLVSGFANAILHWTGGKTFTGNLFGSRDEMRLVMEESAYGLTKDERSLIDRILDMQNLTLRHVMIPLDRVTTVSTGLPLQKVLDLCREKGFTRLPVEQKQAGVPRIIGIVSLKNIMYQTGLNLDKTAGEYVKPALYLHEDMRLDEALRRMRRSGQRLAIVLGRDQVELGVVSLEDILKGMFGEVNL